MTSAPPSGFRVPLADACEFADRERLRKSSVEFRKDVVHVTDGVFVAVGYSASNVVLIQGDGGSIIVDIAANPVDSRAIVAAFGTRPTRPAGMIIYTHNHPDQSGGATVFAGSDDPEIYSHQTLLHWGPGVSRAPRGAGDAFGTTLPDELFTNASTELEYGRITPPTRAGLLRSTRTRWRRRRGDRNLGHSDAIDPYAGRVVGEPCRLDR